MLSSLENGPILSNFGGGREKLNESEKHLLDNR